MNLSPKDKIIKFISDRIPATYSETEVANAVVNHVINFSNASEFIDNLSMITSAILREESFKKAAANEKILYVKAYLEGNMYIDDKPEYREIQLKNANCAYDLTKMTKQGDDIIGGT